MKAIMYHYVRPHDSRIPMLKHLHIDDFCRQLDHFEREYGFVSREDFLDSLRTGKPAKGVVLTFDDGLKCHYNYAFQELKKRGLWGIFYVATGMYRTQKLLDVHRIHILLGVIDSERLLGQLTELVREDMLSDIGREAFREHTYQVQKNDDFTLQVKRTLNYYISYEFRESVIDELIRINRLESLDDYRTFYLDDAEIREMHDNGMIIGSHTERHPVMSKLDGMGQEREIVDSFSYLEKVCGKLSPKTFCYPYGGFHSFTDETEKILTDNGCVFSFNVERRDIDQNDLLNRPQALPRYDCNQFPYGQVR